jgi:hypothetical protein
MEKQRLVFLLTGAGFFVLFILAYFSEIQAFSYIFLLFSILLILFPGKPEKKGQPSKEVLELESQMKGKFAGSLVVEGDPIWAMWCPIHRGAPPPFDPKGYKCQKCAKLVCARCLYITSKGALCTNCLQGVAEEEKQKLKPFYEDSAFSQTRIHYLKLKSFELLSALLVMAIGLVTLSFNLPIWGIVLPPFVILVIICGLGEAYYFFKIRKEERPTTIE